MRCVNRITLLGHLTGDPKQNLTSNGVPLTTFSVATNRRWRDENGDLREFADFHPVVAWHKLAEICAEYLHKGTPVYLEGRLTTSEFTDREGRQQQRSEIILEQLSILTKKETGGGEQEQEEESETKELAVTGK